MVNEVAIRATLEIGDAVSQANQLASATDKVGKSMAQTVVGGDMSALDAYVKKLERVSQLATGLKLPSEVSPAIKVSSESSTPSPLPPQPRQAPRAATSGTESQDQPEIETIPVSVDRKYLDGEDYQGNPDSEGEQETINIPVSVMRQYHDENEHEGKPESEGAEEILRIPVSVLREYRDEKPFEGKPETEGEPESVRIPVSVFREYADKNAFEGIPESTGDPELMTIPVSVIREYLDKNSYTATPETQGDPENMTIPVSVLREYMDKNEFKGNPQSAGAPETVTIPVSIIREYLEKSSFEGKQATAGEPESMTIPVSVLREYMDENQYKGNPKSSGEAETVNIPVSVFRDYTDKSHSEGIPESQGDAESLRIPVSVMREYINKSKFEGTPEATGDAETVTIPVSVIRDYLDKNSFEGTPESEGEPEKIRVPVSVDRTYVEGEGYKGAREATGQREDLTIPVYIKREYHEMQSGIPAQPAYPQQTQLIPSAISAQYQAEQHSASRQSEGLPSTVEYDLDKFVGKMGAFMETALKGGDSVGARDAARMILRARKQEAQYARKTTYHDRSQTRRPRSRGGDIGRIISLARYFGNAIGSGNLGAVATGAVKEGQGIVDTLKGLSGAALAGAGAAAALAVGFAGNKLSEAYEKVMQPSMKLAATLNMMDGTYTGNSKAFQLALDMAGSSATKFGYSMQDGIAVMTDMGKYGMTKDQAMGSASRIFEYERGTSADRGILSQAEGLSKRYKTGDALGYAYGGTFASGLNSGQFQEYLTATLRIFEEGLSKGVVKGFGEITRVQNFIASIAPGNPLWQGEQGYARYKTMSDATVAATGLDREYDVIAFQAADTLYKADYDKAKARGFKDDKEGNWSYYKDLDRDSSIEPMKRLEGGITPELFREEMKTIVKLGAGNDEQVVRAIMKMWNVNFTTAETLMRSNRGEKFADAAGIIRGAPEAQSPEMKLLAAQNDIAKSLADIGASVLPIKANIMGDVRGILNAIAGDKLAKNSMAGMNTLMGIVLPGSSLSGSKGASSRAKDDFMTAGMAALSTKDNAAKNPDKNMNGTGDYADAYWEIERNFANYSDEQLQYLASSGKLSNLLAGKRNAEDLPGILKSITSNDFFGEGFEKFKLMNDPTTTSVPQFIDTFMSSLEKQGIKTKGSEAMQFPSMFAGALGEGKQGALDVMRFFQSAPDGYLGAAFSSKGNERDVGSIFESAIRFAKKDSPEGEVSGIVTSKEWTRIAENLLKILSDSIEKFKTSVDKQASDGGVRVVVPNRYDGWVGKH